MPTEILSTARPTPLRLAGFLCLALGAVAAGVGATLEWASVGFPADVERVADVAVRGTDVWEGKVVLFAAGGALFAMLALRLTRSTATRTALAVALVLIGVACLTLPLLDAVRAEDRFGGTEGVDLMAERLAAELELPEDVVRAQLQEQFERTLRVDVGAGTWLSAAGGVLLIAGGVLASVWARRQAPVAAIDAAG